MTASIGAVTKGARAAGDVTARALAVSAEGAQAAQEAQQRMDLVRGGMNEVLKSAKQVGATSGEISHIVGAIESITDRTQMLAMNASLEAAKAGAAGAGFRVIASEVNRLSEESHAALRGISQLVERLQVEAGGTIRVVEDSSSNVTEGARLSAAASGRIAEVEALSGELLSLMNQIRNEASSQASGAEGVNEAMGRLANLSKAFQASVSEVVSGVRQIDSSMGGLKGSVSIADSRGA
jgi:methyl-accepting chemotaxis protein